MADLNYRHLRYFWMVAKTGSIARASEKLHLTPQSISGQLNDFEARLGVELFSRTGRNLELTDSGQRILGLAEQIFSLGDQIVDRLRNERGTPSISLRLGIADSVSKSMAYRLIAPALKLGDNLRLFCHEGRLASLLATLSIHRLDMIIADCPIPSSVNVRGFSHLLGQSPLCVFGTAQYAKELVGRFPACLDRARFLLPGADAAVRPRLHQWFDSQSIRPHFVGEFDDSALANAFGQAGAGLFTGPSAIADDICEQHKVIALGRIDNVVEQVFAITTERRPSHPAILEIGKSARDEIFAATDGPEDNIGP